MNRIAVTVIYARAGHQAVRRVEVDPSANLGAAVKASGLLEDFPEIDLARSRVGIFGTLADLDVPLRDGDQVEIYRPLAADPNELRRKRAAARGPR